MIAIGSYNVQYLEGQCTMYWIHCTVMFRGFIAIATFSFTYARNSWLWAS